MSLPKFSDYNNASIARPLTEAAFTKQHYQAIADILKKERRLSKGNIGPEDAIDNIALALAKLFEADNSNFRRTQFINACK